LFIGAAGGLAACVSPACLNVIVLKAKLGGVFNQR